MPEVPSPTSIGPALRMSPHQASAEQVQPPSDAELKRIDSYWRTANYLAAGMIYLQDNPLLRPGA